MALLSKTLATSSENDNQASIPWTHGVEGENGLPQIPKGTPPSMKRLHLFQCLTGMERCYGFGDLLSLMFCSQVSELCSCVASAGFLNPPSSDCAIGCGQKMGMWKGMWCACMLVCVCACVCVLHVDVEARGRFRLPVSTVLHFCSLRQISN